MRNPEVPVTLLLIYFPVNVPEKVGKDGMSTWDPITQLENQDGVSGFRLQPGTDLAGLAI